MGAAHAPEVARRLERVRLLVLDVDGVMTDGRIIIDDHGAEQKHFHVHDGVGVWLLRACGIETAIISGRYAACVTVRARELGIAACHQGQRDKLEAFAAVRAHHGVEAPECAFMGDDVVDVPLLRAVGLAAAPRDARPEARSAAHLVTEARGGRGAVRELCEAILRAQGRLDAALSDRYGIDAGA